MRHYISPLLGFFLVLVLVSCKKSIDAGPPSTAPLYWISGNHLKFASIKDYVAITGNADSRRSVMDFVKQHQFHNMAAAEEGPAASRMTPSYSDSTDEDADDLYPEYLQEILNDDSIVQIGDHLLKVDLVNDLGFAIRAGGDDAYRILTASTPVSYPSEVMVFGQDEEVLDVLDWISTGRGTYEDYLQQKWGFNNVPIFCFDKGAAKGEDKRVYNYDGSNYRVKCELTYQKAIIYFRLFLEAKTQKKRIGIWWSDGNTSITLVWDYKWIQRCKRKSGSSSSSLPWVNGPKAQHVAYEDSKSLRQYEMYGRVLVRKLDWNFTQYFASEDLYIMDGY